MAEAHSEQSEIKVTKMGKKTVSIVLFLGIAGQIAWAVENSWFNVFVFDTITPNPNVVAWMVAMSAITATLTTLFMGTVSDRTHTRMGKRKPFIFFGYIIWGLITALFPTVAYIRPIGFTIVMVIIMDAVMTFFGSTANDAAFNAWVTDITDTTNRGRLQAILSIAALIANLIAMGLAGIIINRFGYFVFFYALGGSVSITGLIAGWFIQEPPIMDSEIKAEGKIPSNSQIWADVREVLSVKNIKANRILYLLFLYMAIVGIGLQVSAPYVIIYIENYLGFGKDIISLIGAFVILIAAVVSIIMGMISHKYNRRTALIIITLLTAISAILLALTKNLVPLTILYSFQIMGMLVGGIFYGAWIQDLYPETDRGKYQGIRLIFFVMLPMVIGPPIGASVIRAFGIPTTLNGEAGFIPTPEIFIVGALISFFALIPLLMIPHQLGFISAGNQEKADINRP